MSREGDLVLIYYQNQPSVYARIEAIEPEVKKDWYRVTLLLLTLPPQGVTWILRAPYINGEPFTMGDQPMRLEEVKRLASVKGNGSEDPQGGSGKPAKVIPFKKG
jgi:hypothetical protein